MTKGIIFKTQYNPDYKGSPHQNESGTSVTKPSMSLTVKELMERHTRGHDIEPKEEIYLPDGMEVPVINDLNDLSYKREELEEQKQSLLKVVKDEQHSQQKEKLEQEKAKELAEKQKQNPHGSKPTQPIPPVSEQ